MTEPRKRKLSKAEAGRIGGKTTARRHGIEHYRAAGKKGFLATVARHWQGDRDGYLRYLRANGWLKQVQDLFNATPAEPGEITCIELPAITGLEEDEWPS